MWLNKILNWILNTIAYNVDDYEHRNNQYVEDLLIIGTEEGDKCNRNGCLGILRYTKPEKCSCHLGYPPCSACTSTYLYCPECGWEDEKYESGYN